MNSNKNIFNKLKLSRYPSSFKSTKNTRVIFKLRNNFGISDVPMHQNTIKLLKQNGISQSKNLTEERLMTSPKKLNELNLNELRKEKQIEENLQTKSKRSNQSIKSTRSMRSCKEPLIDPLAVHFESDTMNKYLPQMNLQQLEQKLDEVLRNRIKILLNKKNVKEDTYREYKNKSDQDLQNLINILMKKKTNQKQNTNHIAAWKSLDLKIQFIEKILAEHTAESEILKLFYSIFANKRTEYKKLGKHSNSIIQFKQTLKLLEEIQKLNRTNFRPFKFITNTSTAKNQFKSPKLADYQNFRYEQPKYILKRQTMPFTCYQQNFLRYPGVQVYKHSISQSHKSIPTIKGFYTGMSTTYSSTFVEKKSQLDDYTELDCYKDKLKDLKMRYTQQIVQPNKQIIKTMAKLQKEYSKRKEPKIISIQSTKNQYESITKSQFFNKLENQSFIKSQSKHSRLQQFKSEYKSYLRI